MSVTSSATAETLAENGDVNLPHPIKLTRTGYCNRTGVDFTLDEFNIRGTGDHHVVGVGHDDIREGKVTRTSSLKTNGVV